MMVGPCAQSVKGAKALDEKLKRVVELAKQLQDAVNDCDGGVIGINIERPASFIESSILVNDISGLDGVTFSYQRDGMRWFYTNEYGFLITGAVIGGD